MDSHKMADAVSWYQKQEDLHPLTCVADSNHALLAPRREGKSIVLVCPTCGAVQKNVPTVVMELYDNRYVKADKVSKYCVFFMALVVAIILIVDLPGFNNYVISSVSGSSDAVKMNAEVFLLFMNTLAVVMIGAIMAIFVIISVNWIKKRSPARLL